MTPELYRIVDGMPGALSMMPHPPADALPAAFEFYRDAGVSVVLSMLPEGEAVALGLEAEPARAAQVGIRYLTHPIPDFGLPDMDDFAALIDHIKGLVVAGEHVAVHCRAGIGRSGMVAATTLCALGDNAATAIEKVSQARGISIPDTVEQGKFIAAFSER